MKNWKENRALACVVLAAAILGGTFGIGGAKLSSAARSVNEAYAQNIAGDLALRAAAAQNIPLSGYGLYYRFGLFKQSFEDGRQVEAPDDWTKHGDPWSVRREDESVIVRFANFSVRAVPYDMPVIGLRGVIRTLRLWRAEPGLLLFNLFPRVFHLLCNRAGRLPAVIRLPRVDQLDAILQLIPACIYRWHIHHALCAVLRYPLPVRALFRCFPSAHHLGLFHHTPL